MDWVIYLGVIVLATSIETYASSHEKDSVNCKRYYRLRKTAEFTKLITKIRAVSHGNSSYHRKRRRCHDQDTTGFCAINKVLCRRDGFRVFMKSICARTCGYCIIPTKKPTKKPLKTLHPRTTHPPPYAGKCGKPEVKQARIVAGSTPQRGAWPWQILLSYRGFPVCGGTLISPVWVITAANCVYKRERMPSKFTVRVGEHDRNVVEGSEVDVKTAKIIRHRDFKPFSLNNDIALLKLKQSVNVTKFVQPACLPSRDPPLGSKCYITGWGKTHHPGEMSAILQQGLLPVVSNKACYEKNRHRIPVSITNAMICGGSGGTDLVSGCHGDTGGPFVCNVKGKWELHGSMSHGSPVCKSTETYTVFSRMNYFKDWVVTVMAKE